jgi:hypothetical protein
MKKLVEMACLFTLLLFCGEAFAQTQPVVVIPLNSNKINKQQTINYGTFSLQLAGLQALTINNGCTTNDTDDGPGFIPLALPLGAKIVSVHVNIFDDSSAAVYQVFLGRSATESNTVVPNYIANVSGGSQSAKIVKEDLSPATPETVDEEETFFLLFNPGATGANGFCGAWVTIELP